FREEVMHGQVDDVVASHPPDTRFVVFAHDLHLARDDARAVLGGASVGPGGGQVDSIGTHLAKRHAGEVFTLWMLDGVERGALNRALAGGGESYFVPVDGPLAARHSIAFMNGGKADVELGAQADALFFARRVSPLRER